MYSCLSYTNSSGSLYKAVLSIEYWRKYLGKYHERKCMLTGGYLIRINLCLLLSFYFREERIVGELLRTEIKYVDDLGSVLAGYRDRMVASSTTMKQKAEDIFGNLESVFALHSQRLLPELEQCGENSERIARTFIHISKDMEKIYCRLDTN